jgi:CHAT domain-containing protein
MPRGRCWLLAAALAAACACGPGETFEQEWRSGLALLRDGDFAAAAEYGRTRREKTKTELTGEAHWRWRLLEAEALLEGGKPANAARALTEFQGTPSAEFRVRAAVLEARLALSQSAMPRAGERVAEALRLAREAKREDLELEASLIAAQIAGRLGKAPEAEAGFRAAQSKAKALADPYRQAIAVNGLGMLRLIRSQYDEAIGYFATAQDLYRQAAATHGAAGAMNNLGLCYTQLGDFDRALPLREEVLKVAKPSSLRANALGESGTLYFLQQQPEKAVPLYRQARDLARELGVLPDAARWASNLTAALAALEDWGAAEEALRSALELKPEPRSRVFLELNAAAIALGRGRPAEARAQFEKILASNPEQRTARWQSEAGIANTYVAEKRYAEARRHFDAALGVIEEGRSELNRNEYKLTFLARLIRVYQDYVDFLVEQKDVDRALAVAESSRARLLAERTAAPFGGAKRSREWPRGGNAVWLAYWLAPKRSFLWILNGAKPRLVTLPPEAEIAKLVENYRAFIETSLRDPMLSESEDGKRLFELLIAPAAAEWGARKAAIVVPDGALHQLSFAALPNYGQLPARYWNEDVAIAVAPYLSATADLARTLPAKPAALILGDPVAADPEFPALANAAREMQSVAKVFPGPGLRLVRGADARPEAWSPLKPGGFSVIHIAAHAEAKRQSPLDSAIILSPNGSPNGSPQGQAPAAAVPGQSIRLFARDIVAQPLQSDLVTLSACRSSGARVYAGEGQVGLAWAFLGAGARATVAGLWDVPDASTSDFMAAFYERLSAAQNPAQALRAARRTLIQAGYAKPYYWAPFQCYLR